MLSSLYHDFLYYPLLNTLVFFYNVFGDLGLAIIVLTVLVRLVLYPVAKKSLQHQKSLKKIQPKIKALQEEYKDDKEKLTAEMMNLYKEHNFNPASGCLPLIIQFIILITLYRVFMAGFHLDSNQLYSFIPHPSNFDTHFLGTFDLSQKSLAINFSKLFSKEGIQVFSIGGTILALFASLAQFYQTKMTIRKSLKKVSPKKSPREKKKKNKST